MSKCVNCGSEILTGDIHWEMGLCNNCYNELYKDHKTHISLDKMWLELAQSFRDENEKLQDKVADLEARLTESEKSKESYRLQNEQHHLQLLQFYSRLGVEAFGADIHEKALETLMIMKEQLAEKEKELAEYADINNTLNSGLQEKCILCEEEHNKDKISFAVEQLEKVKGLIANHTQELWTCENDDIDVVLYEEIDKQINELKEGK